MCSVPTLTHSIKVRQVRQCPTVSDSAATVIPTVIPMTARPAKNHPTVSDSVRQCPTVVRHPPTVRQSNDRGPTVLSDSCPTVTDSCPTVVRHRQVRQCPTVRPTVPSDSSDSQSSAFFPRPAARTGDVDEPPWAGATSSLRNHGPVIRSRYPYPTYGGVGPAAAGCLQGTATGRALVRNPVVVGVALNHTSHNREGKGLIPHAIHVITRINL